MARNEQLLGTVQESQRDTYRRLLAEAREQYDEIQRELTALVKVLQDLGA